MSDTVYSASHPILALTPYWLALYPSSGHIHRCQRRVLQVGQRVVEPDHMGAVLRVQGYSASELVWDRAAADLLHGPGLSVECSDSTPDWLPNCTGSTDTVWGKPLESIARSLSQPSWPGSSTSCTSHVPFKSLARYPQKVCEQSGGVPSV